MARAGTMAQQHACHDTISTYGASRAPAVPVSHKLPTTTGGNPPGRRPCPSSGLHLEWTGRHPTETRVSDGFPLGKGPLVMIVMFIVSAAFVLRPAEVSAPREDVSVCN